MLDSAMRKLFGNKINLKRFFNNGKKNNAQFNAQAHSFGKSPDPPAVFGFEGAEKAYRRIV
jgi:hypothetical protein